ncbi:unnamed protein product [Haemonchus placei]|uniref:Fatty acid synthase n=1 Tax=Haemonchus placei TaxID=6290 RepID=A0A158QNC2_HAEPC|nr:unnamed protein product [Haemonchus placei]
MSSNDQPWWKEQEEIVISGVSGRFPRCENVNEFGDLLLQGEDLVTEDDLRWPPGFYDLPKRHGKLKDLKKFDAQFFSVTPKQANFMDPQVRILLEVAWEAMVDAGINPVDLRGSRTGVFVGCSASETSGALTQDPETVTGYTLTGCVRSMFSNRISYTFDLQGPSFSVDTACSSSLLALQLAVDAIRQKQCDAAIVAGAHLTLTPTAALQFLRLGMLTEKGSCRSFDDSGDGYCRTEGVAAIYIQRKSKANRIYATVVHAKSNTDGYKEQGITFPSGERQAQLLEEVYNEAGVDPNTVYYVETHGTGTKVGDPQEANAICQVFCSNRKEPLLIGSVKSNMGHAEPASGLCSIAKVLVAIERQMIPPNLHFNTPNQYIPGLTDGRLKVVTEPTPLPGGIIGVNSFGFGGSNTHVILKAADHTVPPLSELPFTKILTYCGRTQDAVHHVFSVVENNVNDGYLQALLANQANLPAKDTPYRGYMLINRGGDQPPLKDVVKVTITEPRPIYFIYSGMGSQWPGMGMKLMKIPVFDESLRASSKTLEEFGLDVYGMLCNPDPAQYQNNTLNCMLAITAIQIALTDLLFSLGVTPDGIIGHSTGEMGCGYADGGITREQTMRLAYHRGTTMMKHKEIKGGMAAVGLTWEEARAQCPPGVVPACHNGADSVTISGDGEKVLEFCEQLKEKGVFAKAVDSSGIPFHSPMMARVKEPMLEAMRTAVPEPKPRSSRWISTSIPEEEWESELASTCSADYHVNNAISPVLFYEALQKIPPNAVTIEMAPHSLMQAILRRSLMKTVSNVGLMNKPKTENENELETFLQSLGKIYQAGVNIRVEDLYPGGRYKGLVPKGTPMIGPMWKWDHSQDWPVIDGRHMAAAGGGSICASASYHIDPFAADSKESYLLDHCIDGRVLYPFTGYLVLAWKTLAKLNGVDFQKTAVVFENINVYSAIILTKPIKLDCVVTPGNGQFEIISEEQVAASGRIYIPEENQPFYYGKLSDIRTSEIADRIELDTEDAYKEFLLRGYEYGQAFRGIYKTCNSGERGYLYWTGNWVTFLDSLLQTALLAERADTLRLPTRVRHLRIDPVKHLEHLIEKDGIQVFELRNDHCTHGCIAGGVECCDLTAHTVARRIQTSGQLYHERIFFVPHYDDNCMKDFEKERNILEQYTRALKYVVARGLDSWEKQGILPRMTNGQILKSVLKAFAPLVKENVTEQEMRVFLDDSKCSVLHAFDEIFALEFSNDMTATDFEALVVSKLKNVKTVFDFDRVWSAALSLDRIIKTMQDICIENSAGHHAMMCAVELNSFEQLKQCVDALLSHPLLELECICVGPNVDQLDDNSLEQIGARKVRLNIDESFTGHNDVKNMDYMLLDKVLSRKADPVAYLNACKHLIRDDGFAIVVEVTSDYELAAAIQGMFGFELSVTTGRRFGTYFTHDELLKLFRELDRDYAWEVPENWSLAEASTVPVVYTTAYYALVCRGRIKKGEKVLIHGGAGGVGQAAIAIALSYGCEVFTTVGSQEKREYLKKKFPQLKDVHFANSRSADFELHIRQYTKGRGVNIVLNSLAHEMLQASLRCLARHGRFLEIGKVDLAQNSSLGMSKLLDNVTIHGILLDSIMDPTVGDFEEWKEVAALLEQGIKSGVVQPLPASLFPADKAEEAFRFMSAGKHIGKVVMEIRKEEPQRKCPPSDITVRAICRTLCHPQHVYLITGGLGGFGLELAQWLINRGARKLVLTSRSGIRTGYQARCVHFWRRTGISVLISTLNIAKRSDADELIRQCLSMGRLGGVFHLAMVLRDCLFENQNVQNFKDAAEAKYYGTINLDQATRAAGGDALRWFVVFSSITSGRGNAGQTNYGWSNSTMERMIEQRREDGYPGIAIQWGAIGDVGVILENMGDNNTVVGGTLPQRMPSCLASLDLFLSWNHPIVSSYIKADMGQKKAAGGGNLLQTIAHILGVNDVSQLNPDANLGDLGLDSLMGVEIKQALERDYDIVLSMKDIRTLTLNKLQQLAESGGQGATTLQPTELDMKKESERDAEQNTVEMLEKQMNQLFKMRVDVNDLDPQDIVIEEGPVTFFVHSIEGIATPLKRVMTKCTFPVYCFQSTKEVPQDSIESVAKCYIREMKKIQPAGPYRIVGYSYGACIGFEMATMLQESDGPSAVERLILLDGSHLYMQTYRNVYRMAFGVTGDTLVNNPLFESEIMCAMTLRFANVDYKKFRVELLQQPGFKARIQKVVDTVMTTGLFKSPETIAFACEAMRSKFLMADKYKPERKFTGLITLVRAEQGAAREEDVGTDYGISQVADDSKVYVVEGDHDTFVQGKSSAKTVAIINELIKETYKC